MEFHLELTPNSLSGKVATHTAIAAPESRAPAKALISTEATGYVEPRTAPSSPATGEDFAPCNYFQKVYKSMCPNAWVEKWDDQRESGTFPGRI